VSTDDASLDAFFAACEAGDIARLRASLAEAPERARARHRGTTGLHLAVPNPDAVRLLLEHGADPEARDEGDNATPLHFAAGGGPLETVRALLDAGADPVAAGDVHELEAIGWATVFAEARREVVALLVERGARHHAFSAIALGDIDVLKILVADDPAALSRRLSPFEQSQSVLHYVIAPPDGLVGGLFRTGDHYATLEALIDLGADLEAVDAGGRTPLDVAFLHGDGRAIRALLGAGARMPEPPEAGPATLSELGASVRGPTPMVTVSDMEATIDWYRSIGFELAASHGEPGRVDWASMTLGDAEIMFVPGPFEATGVSLWLRTARLDEIYAVLKRRQYERVRQAIEDGRDPPDDGFVLDLYTAFYGQREFGLRDPNGLELTFFQPL